MESAKLRVPEGTPDHRSGGETLLFSAKRAGMTELGRISGLDRTKTSFTAATAEPAPVGTARAAGRPSSKRVRQPNGGCWWEPDVWSSPEAEQGGTGLAAEHGVQERVTISRAARTRSKSHHCEIHRPGCKG